jgi:NADH-quinone oxidoreductase subunit G
MCDYGRLNYKWIGREDRLKEVRGVGQSSAQQKIETVKQSWAQVLREVSQRLGRAERGSVAIVASARQTNEELYLLAKLAKQLGALTDSVPRISEGDKLLLNSNRNPNSAGARLTGMAAEPMGSNLPQIAQGIRNGKIKTLIVFGEDVTKYGIPAELLAKLEALIVSDILPNETTRLAHYLLPGCAHAEKRGSFTNIKGRIQRFMKAVEPPGEARPEWEFLHELVLNVTGKDGYVSIEGLFDQMAQEVPAFKGLTWASLGDTGVTVQI